MSVWTIVLIFAIVLVVAGVVVYFDMQSRQQPTDEQRLGRGVGDVVTSIVGFAT